MTEGGEAASGEVWLRESNAADRPFLAEVYASTRREELALTDWDEARKQEFLEQQFAAQDAWYREHYRPATFSVVMYGDEPVGRLYVARFPDDVRVMDVAILPAWRGRGIGERLLREVMAEGAASGRPVTIHVERMNPALRLYERLGFRLAEDKGVYLFLRWER